MQEYGWLNWNDFGQMACRVVPGASQRKIRLAACAIVRRLVALVTDQRTAAALDAAEEYADFGIRRQDLRRLAAAAGDVVRELKETLFPDKAAAVEVWKGFWYGDEDVSATIDWQLRRRAGQHPSAQLARIVAQVANPRAFDARDLSELSCSVSRLLDPQGSSRDAQSPHCDLIRDIFGNPFRPVAFDPSWRTEAAVGLARGIYETRDFGPLPVLADALEDAGCADPDVLAHCRGPGPHVRGCWVVDLVLGKT